jgi:signal-transduction protein with cAMP-binding, CBS, and nucleotidyltransferase domain
VGAALRVSAAERFRTMVLRAQDLMHTDLLLLEAGTTALDAARQMAAAHKGYLLVARDGLPSAMLTEWDFVSKILATGRDPTTVRIGDIATSPLVTMDAETPTDELVAAMAARGIRRMLLTSGGRVVGIVTSKEVLQAFQTYIDKLSADISRLQIPSM